MNTSIFRIALAQVNPTVGALNDNARLIADCIQRARALGADLVAFPEMCLVGYPPEDLLLRQHFIDDSRDSLDKLAPASDGITAVVGCVNSRGKKVYNAAAVLHRGRKAGTYFKQFLPNYGVFDEKRYFHSGTENIVWQLNGAGNGAANGVAIGVSVCEDIWFADGPHLDQARAGAGIILNISSSPYHAGKIRERQRMLQARARSTGAYVCYVNLAGGQDELIFDGGSLIIDPAGKLLAVGRQFEEDFIVADLDLSAVRGPMRPLPPARPVSVRKLDRTRQTPARPPIVPHMAPAYDRWEEVYRALMIGLQDYVSKNGFQKVVIGLSGGVDSAITAAIAADALGPENVIGVTMPSRYTSHGTLTDAERLAQNLGIRLITLPIETVFKSYLEELAETFKGLPADSTEENIQARIRGNFLLALSNKYGWLVLTTGNKSETSVGYCTLYGDMAGGFSLLKDVFKTSVWELSKHRNRKAGTDVIPQSVIDRVPTAELRPNQTDQDTLPPYDVLDDILQAYIEMDKGREEIIQMGFDPVLVNRVAGMVDRNEYKRRQAAPGLKITPKAFGRDRRMPITNRYV